jgi:hypothetical protein
MSVVISEYVGELSHEDLTTKIQCCLSNVETRVVLAMNFECTASPELIQYELLNPAEKWIKSKPIDRFGVICFGGDVSDATVKDIINRIGTKIEKDQSQSISDEIKELLAIGDDFSCLSGMWLYRYTPPEKVE